MSVTLSPPAQLGFPRPLTQIVKRSLLIQNPNSTPVAFKVKTTAPKQYCVRPNQGRVEPGETVEVQIVLQPLPEDPPPHAKCKDKFLVQSALIPPGEELHAHTLQELWLEVERLNKAAIHEQKIRCAYLAPEDGTGNPNGIPEENEEQSPIDHSRMDESHANFGHTRWTTTDRTFDPLLFPNGGHTVWEMDGSVMPIGRGDPLRKQEPAFQTLPQTVHYTTVVVLPVNGIYSAAEASPAGKYGGDVNGDKHLPATPSASGVNNNNVNTSLAASAGALGGAGAGAGIFSALNQQHNNTTTAAHSANTNTREIPSLSANDTQNIGAPTNVALERSLEATTSDKEKLNIALLEIERLRSQLNEAQGPSVTGLRKRGGVGATDNSGANTQLASKVTGQQAASGVPIEVVAGLVFGVFILTYLFF